MMKDSTPTPKDCLCGQPIEPSHVARTYEFGAGAIAFKFKCGTAGHMSLAALLISPELLSHVSLTPVLE